MIYELLSEGAENAITAKDLCRLLNCHPRDISLLVERERREGHPICASCGEVSGYYLAGDRETMQEYCDRLHHRAAEIYKTRRACLDAAATLPDRGEAV